MSVNLPTASVVFGSVTPPPSDIIDLRVHLGCTNEISSFDCLLQNFDKKYSPGGTHPINVGIDGNISLGRGINCPLILTLKVEEIEPQSTATENYIRVRGRCWGEQLFRRLVTKSYDNVKGEAVVKDIVDNYTSLSHVRNSVELIEDTDTSYTRLDYEDTPVFDVLKYIAETADEAGVIGYDFRIAADGKFEFFPKNSKTSSVSLLERLEVSEYSKNIHRIKNKITVYGAAERTKPSNEDSWTDGTADQSQSDAVEDQISLRTYQLVSTLTFTPSANQKIALKKVQLDTKMDASGTHTGQYKVTYQKGAGPETDLVTDQAFTNTAYETKANTCAINGDFGEQLTIKFYTRVSAGPYDGELVYSKNYHMYYDILTYDWDPDQAGLGITLDTTDKLQGTSSVKVSATTVTWAGATLTLADVDKVNGNKFANINVKVKLGSNYKGSGQIYLYSTQTPPDNYVSQPINVAVGTWQNLSFALGRKNRQQWFGNPTTFDWTQIKKIRLVFDIIGTNSSDFWFDHMFFGCGRWEATREDSASQTQYGLREKVETDEELHSDAECDYRAKALLDFLKGPIETVKVRGEVVDYGTSPILAGDKIHVTIPNENIDSDYRIISVEYKASGRDQTLEVELELAKEPQLLADFIYGFRKSIAKLDKYKASSSAGGVSNAGGGGGGGGGMVEHANEWHDPDMALVTHNHNLADLAEKLHASLASVTADQHHRAWNWADEQGFNRCFVLPYADLYGWTRQNGGDPILALGSAGEWDAFSHYSPCVVYDKDNEKWYMYYSGSQTALDVANKIGVAYSTLGLTSWTKSVNNPLISPIVNESVIKLPYVVYDIFETDSAKKWKIWFYVYMTDTTHKVRYCYASNPEGPFTNGGYVTLPANYYRWNFTVMRMGNLYYCGYLATDNKLHGAIGSSPTNLSTDLGILIDIGATGAWDDTSVSALNLYWNMGVYYAVYCGYGGAGAPYRLGLALSSNGLTYTKFPSATRNILLNLGAAGKFDDTYILTGAMVMYENQFRLFYEGRSATSRDRIGLVTIP